jgi:hypothetical protein
LRLKLAVRIIEGLSLLLGQGVQGIVVDVDQQ